MGGNAATDDFRIHVDPSCLTDSTDLRLPSKRNHSDQTVIHTDTKDEPEEDSRPDIGEGGKELDENHDDHPNDHPDEHLDDHENPTASCISEVSDVSTDEHTEALIQAAARAVVASMEKGVYGHADSELSIRTYESREQGTELSYENGTEITDGGTQLTYGDGTEGSYESEDEEPHEDPYDGSASSHEEDDIFSEHDRRSNRSSLNSSDEQHTDEDGQKAQKLLGGPHKPISRLPSNASDAYSLLPEPLALPWPRTPSKVLNRPPFRTPSSVRALQMSSPTPSLFSSPRSNKRPTVSRLGTPSNHTQNSSPSKNKTPARFKAKQEYPLVLLHVTVLPLHWPYSTAMDAAGPEDLLSKELITVRDSWHLLREKLGETVLQRGILLPHPQDSYEILEERLLEALELPVRPRVKILTCGHYLGPDEDDLTSEEESESEDREEKRVSENKWCDVCRKEVKCEEFGIGARQRRFKVKVYASNGLMRAGAWTAAWKEMERVDAEIEPLISPHLIREMNELSAANPHSSPTERYEDEEVHEDETPEEVEVTRRRLEEERLREIYGHSIPLTPRTRRRQNLGDSFPELLLAACKVAMRDRRNVLILVLSLSVLVLSLWPSSGTGRAAREAVLNVTDNSAAMASQVVESGSKMVEDTLEKIIEMPSQVVSAVKAATDEAIPVLLPTASSSSAPEQQVRTEEVVENQNLVADNGDGATPDEL